MSYFLKTGQRYCYDVYGKRIECSGTFQDGDVQPGIIESDPRFVVDGDIVAVQGFLDSSHQFHAALSTVDCWLPLTWAGVL